MSQAVSPSPLRTYLDELIWHPTHPGEREDRAVRLGVTVPLQVEVHGSRRVVESSHIAHAECHPLATAAAPAFHAHTHTPITHTQSRRAGRRRGDVPPSPSGRRTPPRRLSTIGRAAMVWARKSKLLRRPPTPPARYRRAVSDGRRRRLVRRSMTETSTGGRVRLWCIWSQICSWKFETFANGILTCFFCDSH